MIVANREPMRVLAEELLAQESLDAPEIRALLASAGARTEAGVLIEG